MGLARYNILVYLLDRDKKKLEAPSNTLKLSVLLANSPRHGVSGKMRQNETK